MLCKNCGTPNIEGAVKCVECGRLIDSATGNQISNLPQKAVGSWLIPAVITNACCCLPLGIVAVYYAAKANAYNEKGDFYNGKLCADKAKTWSVVGIALGFVLYVIYFVFSFISDFGKSFKLPV